VMHESKKSDLAVVAVKPTNKAGCLGGGAGGAKGEDRGERDPVKHAPDSEPDSRVPGAGRVREVSQVPRRYASSTRGGSRVRKSCMLGSVRGAHSNVRPYRER
jgi:hypothetical protein